MSHVYSNYIMLGMWNLKSQYLHSQLLRLSSLPKVEYWKIVTECKTLKGKSEICRTLK